MRTAITLSPTWQWSTVLKETSGKAGYRVDGTGNATGLTGQYRWTGRNGVLVPPGGKITISHSLTVNRCGEYQALFDWIGEDSGGHAIELHEEIELKCTSK